MSTLLLVKASPRIEHSNSNLLADSFVEAWGKSNPNSTLMSRNVGPEHVQGPNQDWISANHTPVAARSAEQNRLLSLSDELISEIHRASHIVIATPMYNFSTPWNLKAYIDLIVRVGLTFSFSEGKGFGPLVSSEKKLLLIWTSAGEYAPGTQFEPFNLLTPYIRNIFAFLGVTNFTEVTAGNQFAPPQIATDSIKQANEQLLTISSTW